MPDTPGHEIKVERLTKRFGPVLAVDSLSFTVLPGRVTGFLGPNGAGKTTTLRMLLGLVRPTSGTATIGGRTYDHLADPLRTVGAALEATGFHSGRTARDHLRVLAAAAGLPDSRADAVLEQTGLAEVAGRRVGGFSLGMRQRLALAAALLGDPGVLLLDEPANGLDPAGIAWLRGFLRHLSSTGRTVLVSSHVLSEVRQTVDDVVIISRGRLVRAAPLADLERAEATVVVTPAPERLATALAAAGLEATPAPSGGNGGTGGNGGNGSGADLPSGDGALRVTAPPATVGSVAFAAGVELHELRRDGDLERIFLSLTADPGPPGPAGDGAGPEVTA